MSEYIKFIERAGGCIVSKNILEGRGKLKWCVREKSVNPADNGWRFFSDIDTEEYLNNASNLTICDFNTVANIEPAIIRIYLLPVGTDLELVTQGRRKVFYDNLTGNEIKFNN